MNDRKRLLKRETQRVMDYLLLYKREFHGMAPSIREIASACFMGNSQVINHLDVLEAHGIIRRETGKARGIWIVSGEE